MTSFIVLHLNARTNEPLGKDLCARWMATDEMLKKVWIWELKMLTGCLWGTGYIWLWLSLILARSLARVIHCFWVLRRQPCAVRTELIFLFSDAFLSIGGTCPGSRQVFLWQKLYSQHIAWVAAGVVEADCKYRRPRTVLFLVYQVVESARIISLLNAVYKCRRLYGATKRGHVWPQW